MRALVLVLALLVGGCAVQPPACPAGSQASVAATLAFGRSIPGGGIVSDTDWQRFLEQEATPRFPDGLTVIDARGQWRGVDLVSISEPSLLLWVVTDQAGVGRAADLAAAYRAWFRQQSVLVTTSPVCAAF